VRRLTRISTVERAGARSPLDPAGQLEGEADLALQLGVADRLGGGAQVLAVVIAPRVLVEALDVVGDPEQLMTTAGVADLGHDDAEGVVVGK
jgi:hypothetical protein